MNFLFIIINFLIDHYAPIAQLNFKVITAIAFRNHFIIITNYFIVIIKEIAIIL